MFANWYSLLINELHFLSVQTNNVDRDQVKAAIKAQQDQQIENVSTGNCFQGVLAISTSAQINQVYLELLEYKPKYT